MGNNGKTMTWLERPRWSYLWVLVLPALLPISVWLGATAPRWPNAYLLLPPLALFVVLPIVDFLIGIDERNPYDNRAVDARRELLLRTLPGLALPGVLLNLWLILHVLTHAAWLSAFGAVTLIWSAGIISATLGITAAHELIHKDSRLERCTGGLLLAMVGYGTFKVEHVRGHHAWVATPNDPSSAARGTSIYAFLPRAIASNIANAWRLEAQRLKLLGLPVLHYRNELLWWNALSVSLAAFIAVLWGWLGVLIYLAHNLVSVLTLESINYVEHYGLRRARLGNGRYEPPNICHSWNSSFLFSNLMLFQLQRHSDHHAHPKRPYPELCHYAESPQLPGGYASMLLLIYVPPLWRRLIHPRIPQTGNESTNGV